MLRDIRPIDPREWSLLETNPPSGRALPGNARHGLTESSIRSDAGTFGGWGPKLG